MATGGTAEKGGAQTSTFPRGFPTQAELLQIAALAKIKTGSQTHFIEDIKELIEQAHIDHKLFQDGPKTYRAVLRRLKRIANHAQKLADELHGVVEAGSSAAGDPEKTFTYDLLNEAIDRSPGGPWKSDQGLAEYIQKLSDFSAVSQRAQQKAEAVFGRRGRPAGAGGNYAFDLFIQHFHLNFRTHGGRLTNAPRRAGGKWSGSFIEALDILEPYLPKFFPPAETGRAVQNIVGNFRAYMKAHRSEYRRRKTKNRRSRP
jgi:hypothetical protein